MKLLRHYRILSKPLVFLVAFLSMSFTTDKLNPENQADAPAPGQTIMLALLLDTSNSMDGLIDQAKSQLWKIVNEMAAAKGGGGKQPNIKIALYEYGNNGLSAEEGHIRQVSALTEDLDVLSEKLFSLTTNGGNEFCGQVIKASLNQLAWSASDADLKMIFIAGNEPFTQGSISYDVACGAAREKGVVVNTIYCGEFSDGITLNWKRGAELTGGTYMSIEQNSQTVYVPTPYDDQIAALNNKLNATYVYYGASGEHRKEQQILQDKNAASYGMANMAERSFCKSSHAYKNSSWDLVDAAKDNERIITETKTDDLPKEMRTMTMAQRKVYIAQKSEERTKIQVEIQSLNTKRQDYISKNTPQSSKDKMLDASMMKAIKEQGCSKKLTWKEGC
ncbi:MAG: VWA domain-containing protein [Chryseolinea sp.]